MKRNQPTLFEVYPDGLSVQDIKLFVAQYDDDDSESLEDDGGITFRDLLRIFGDDE